MGIGDVKELIVCEMEGHRGMLEQVVGEENVMKHWRENMSGAGDLVKQGESQHSAIRVYVCRNSLGLEEGESPFRRSHLEVTFLSIH